MQHYLKYIGVNPDDFRIINEKGYGDNVYILGDDKPKYVIKRFNDFSPYPTIPKYCRSRIELEKESYDLLMRIHHDLTPMLLYHHADDYLIIYSFVSKPYVEYQDYLNDASNTKSQHKKLFDEFANFFINKTEIKKKIQNPFYFYPQVKQLRSLFVHPIHANRIDFIFERGMFMRKAYNIGGMSPKNIFIDPLNGKFKLIDFEESFEGDYLYDIGFFIGHLLLYVSSQNCGLIEDIKRTLNRIDYTFKWNKYEKDQVLSYAGLIILHRADGFNIKFKRDTTLNKHEIGTALLYGNDIFSFF